MCLEPSGFNPPVAHPSVFGWVGGLCLHPSSDGWADFAYPLPTHPAYTPSSPAPSVLYSLVAHPSRFGMGGVQARCSGILRFVFESTRSHPFWEKWVGRHAVFVSLWPFSEKRLGRHAYLTLGWATMRIRHTAGPPCVLDTRKGACTSLRLSGVESGNFFETLILFLAFSFASSVDFGS